MPAKDSYHDTVKRAPIKDGWVISREPFLIRLGLKRVSIDLSAEKETVSTAACIEVKDFDNPSSVEALRESIGQHVPYRAALKYVHLENSSHFLAVPRAAYESLFAIPLSVNGCTMSQNTMVPFRQPCCINVDSPIASSG